jgi:hypothetical protein
MSRNTTLSNSLVNSLNVVQEQVMYSLLIPLIVGLLGNIGSCIVFRQKELRSNGISQLFTVASMFNIIVLLYGIVISLYSINHISPDSYLIVFCKFRLYIRHILLMIVRSYIILACAASFSLSSSQANIRSLFQSRYVKRIIFIVPLIWPLIALHMPFFTIIHNNRCINIDSYVLPFGIYFFLIVGIFPIVLMVLFLLLTKNNLRLLNRRIQPTIVGPMRLKSRDQQFLRMLSSLVLMYIITNLFYPTNVLYLSLTYWSEKSPERVAIESLIYSVTSNHILYINNVSPFYLFMYSSTTFRKLFFNFICKYTRHILTKTNRIQPLSTTVPLREHNGILY